MEDRSRLLIFKVLIDEYRRCLWLRQDHHVVLLLYICKVSLMCPCREHAHHLWNDRLHLLILLREIVDAGYSVLLIVLTINNLLDMQLSWLVIVISFGEGTQLAILGIEFNLHALGNCNFFHRGCHDHRLLLLVLTIQDLGKVLKVLNQVRLRKRFL